MNNVFFKQQSHSTEMVSSIEDFYRNSNFTDCVVACGGRTFSTHRIVLASGSTFFKNCLVSQQKSIQNPVLVITEFSADVIEVLIEFLYRGQVVIPIDRVEELRNAASKLQIKGFENFVRSQLAQGNQFKFQQLVQQQQQQLNALKEKKVLKKKIQKPFLGDSNVPVSSDLMSSAQILLKQFQETVMRQNVSSNESMETSSASDISFSPEKMMTLGLREESLDVAAKKRKIEQLINSSNRRSVVPPVINGKNSDEESANGNKENINEERDNKANDLTEASLVASGSGSISPASNKENLRDSEINERENGENYTYEMNPSNFNWMSSANAEHRSNLGDDDDSESENSRDAMDDFSKLFNQSLLAQYSMAGMSKVKCDQCDKAFENLEHLRSHIRRHHGLSRLNECDICGKSYAWKSGLYKHKRAVHGLLPKLQLAALDNIGLVVKKEEQEVN